MGKHEYNNVFDAMDKFLNIMQSRILSNRRRVKDGEPPEYFCQLWGSKGIKNKRSHR